MDLHSSSYKSVMDERFVFSLSHQLSKEAALFFGFPLLALLGSRSG